MQRRSAGPDVECSKRRVSRGSFQACSSVTSRERCRHDAGRGSALDKMREFVRQEIGVYVHQLPVTQGLTVEAGQTIWGYPNLLADIDVTHKGNCVACSLAHDRQQVLTIELHEGGPIKLKDPNLPNYSLRDGVLRMSEWNQEGTALTGGSRLKLGSHPTADELRSLGLPKRAFMSTTMHGGAGDARLGRRSYGVPAERRGVEVARRHEALLRFPHMRLSLEGNQALTAPRRRIGLVEAHGVIHSPEERVNRH